MQKLIKNDWRRESDEPFACAQILRHEIHPEGLDVDRIRFFETGCITMKSGIGHVISVLRGSGRFHLKGDDKQTFCLEAGVHLYIPPGPESILDAEPGTELLRVSSPSVSQASGKKLLLRNETFLAACTSESQSLRWILTPQYLSRRIFLRHDPILLSKSGDPVSWFHTTMFDVIGLPINEDGEPVFKMSYNSRTEVNLCYDVKGLARVRMAQHPYREAKQLWGPWLPLDGDSTYHLNEAAGGLEEESHIDEVTQTSQTLRNKHEVYIIEGHVSLFCLFDPAPTGIEHHRPGEYSDYEPLSQVLGTKSYEIYAREVKRYDEMVDRLSMAKAMGKLKTLYGTPIWELYLRGWKAQAAIENELIKTLTTEGKGRERVIARWLQPRLIEVN
ncbi:hypothetical protein ACFL2Y_00690 [Candidatus Omnitrophota bacterium]